LQKGCFFLFGWGENAREKREKKEIGKAKLVRLFVIDESGVAE
jgi:hypothetical protein